MLCSKLHVTVTSDSGPTVNPRNVLRSMPTTCCRVIDNGAPRESGTGTRTESKRRRPHREDAGCSLITTISYHADENPPRDAAIDAAISNTQSQTQSMLSISGSVSVPSSVPAIRGRITAIGFYSMFDVCTSLRLRVENAAVLFTWALLVLSLLLSLIL